MKIKTLAFTFGFAAVLCASSQQSLAADEDSGAGSKPTAAEKMFMKKAADGGMTEVELGPMMKDIWRRSKSSTSQRLEQFR